MEISYSFEAHIPHITPLNNITSQHTWDLKRIHDYFKQDSCSHNTSFMSPSLYTHATICNHTMTKLQIMEEACSCTN